MAQKITIRNDGVYVDDVRVPSVIGAESKNINPGTTGSMEVALIFPACEVDVQYKLHPTEPDDWQKALIMKLNET